MTINRAQELLQVRVDFGGFYNGNVAKIILSEVNREHGQQAVDFLIREMRLDEAFGFVNSTDFDGGLAVPEKRNTGNKGHLD